MKFCLSQGSHNEGGLSSEADSAAEADDDIDAADVFRWRACGHALCRGCAQRYLASALGARARWPGARLACIAFSAAVNASPAPAPIRFATMYGSNMVLQRAPVSAVVWGFAPPGTKVTTTFGTQKIVSPPSSRTGRQPPTPP